MSKFIEINDTNLEVEVSTINVIKIGTLSFEIEEGYPWIDVYLLGGDHKEFLIEIDGTEGDIIPTGIDTEEFKAFCLNWYFNNVQIVDKWENLRN